MREPLISIIVPVHEAPEDLLRRAFASVLGQTLSAIEVIAVDDASPDDCPRILDELAAADRRVTVIHRRANGRAGAARNDGLDVARGEYVLFVDADDVLRADMCESLVAKARECEADIVQGSWFETDPAGNTVRQYRLPERAYDLSRSRDRARCLHGLRFAPWGKLFRREALGGLRFETFEANIGEDTLFNVAALCRVRRMVTTSCMGYGYTVHGESATGRAAKGMPYLRTIIASNRRIREVLLAEAWSTASRSAADWLPLKRFTTGCEWIGDVQNDDERRALWDFWRRYFHETLAPGTAHHRVLLGWYRLALSGGPAYAGKATRCAVRVIDRFTRGGMGVTAVAKTEKHCAADHGASVSVVIPAFNAERCLDTCLDSVQGQTMRPREIIVVNDGSEDGTAVVARTYGDRIIYREQSNQGQGAARNAGLGLASAAYVAFLDADDYWHPQFLERTVRFLERHPDVVAVSTGSITRLHDGRERVGPPCAASGTGPGAPLVLDDFYRFWAEEDHVRTGSVLIRRSVIKEAGGQRADLRISQDLEYWAYLATFGKWGFIPEPLWIGNSRAVGRRSGWLRKYRKRRRLCPSVEAWQERVFPRLTDAQRPHFLKVRGRVAAGYAHARILGGNRPGAWDIVQKYGDDMPQNRVTRLMRLGQRTGRLGWHLVCALLITREHFK